MHIFKMGKDNSLLVCLFYLLTDIIHIIISLFACLTLSNIQVLSDTSLLRLESFENCLPIGEIAQAEQFLLLQQCFNSI